VWHLTTPPSRVDSYSSSTPTVAPRPSTPTDHQDLAPDTPTPPSRSTQSHRGPIHDLSPGLRSPGLGLTFVFVSTTTVHTRHFVFRYTYIHAQHSTPRHQIYIGQLGHTSFLHCTGPIPQYGYRFTATSTTTTIQHRTRGATHHHFRPPYRSTK
jgi:hypothetical protein